MSVYYPEYDGIPQTKRTRLVTPLALRDLIKGREFEINDDDYCEDDYNLCKDEFNQDEIKDYINIDALDLDVDEDDKVICFADLRKKMTPVTSDGRLMKRIKNQGLGEILPSSSVVYYHYSAYVNLQEEPFDNSYLRGRNPQRLVLGEGAAIYGVEIALKTMKKGEVSQFIIEPEYAFGKFGCPPRVPPEATVLFKIELVDFVEASDADEISRTQYNENEDVTEKFKRLYKLAEVHHSVGNDYFKKTNHKMAAVRYRRARDILLNLICKDEEDEKMKNQLLVKIFSNLAICYNKLNKPNQVCIACRDALYFNEEEAQKNPKLIYNWGLALMDFGEYVGAKNKFRAALKLQPNSEEIKEALKKLEEKIKYHNHQSKLTFRKMFRNWNEPVDVKEEKSDLSEDMVFMLKQKFEEAKLGRTVELVLPDEVRDNFLDTCVELATKDIQILRRGNKLIISRKVQ